MRIIEVGAGVAPGTPLAEYLKGTFPDLGRGALHAALRKKDVRVNGARAGEGARVSPGDALALYIPDEALFGGSAALEVVYEDADILVVNKPRGAPVHPDRNVRGATVIERVWERFGFVDATSAPVPPHLPAAGAETDGAPFRPQLCHRLDRNTGGLLLIAKTREALAFFLSAMQGGAVEKRYLCYVVGAPKPASANLDAWLVKDAGRGNVRVGDAPSTGALKIETSYRTMNYDAQTDVALLEVTLGTGRTHQIRAQLAHIGHPVVGDGKYGRNAVNRRYGETRQMLWAYSLVFGFRREGAGRFAHLSGARFHLPSIPDPPRLYPD